jgi:4-amino-4-deoxy-L-arabinose transferase-like glycosyltransferase
MERWAGYAPWFILLYFALQIAVRISISANLEMDEAEMVDAIGWAWGYRNSHPPLFHWIMRLCHDLIGYWPAVSAVSRFGILAAAYLLVYDAARRAGGTKVAGALALASLFLLPTAAWKTETKLTHSILCFLATAAVVHALVLIATRRRVWTFAWLGFAAAIGLLAKYNFVFVLMGVAVAVLSVASMRKAFHRREAWLALVIPVALTLPHVMWIRAHPTLAMERAYMLKTAGSLLGAHFHANSVADGFLTLGLCTLMAVGPAIALWLLAARMFRRDERNAGAIVAAASEIQRVLAFLLLSELGVFVLAIALGGFSQVHERYLLPLLPPLPVWLVLAFGRKMRTQGAAAVLSLGVLLAVFISLAWPRFVLGTDNQLTFPYAAMVSEIAAVADEPMAVAGDRADNVANVVLHWPGARFFHAEEKPARVLVVNDGVEDPAEFGVSLGASYRPDGEIRVITRPYASRTGNLAQLAVQRWRRVEP